MLHVPLPLAKFHNFSLSPPAQIIIVLLFNPDAALAPSLLEYRVASDSNGKHVYL